MVQKKLARMPVIDAATHVYTLLTQVVHNVQELVCCRTFSQSSMNYTKTC